MKKANVSVNGIVKLVKCIVVDNSINKGWNVGDGIELPKDHEFIKKGFCKEVK